MGSGLCLRALRWRDGPGDTAAPGAPFSCDRTVEPSWAPTNQGRDARCLPRADVLTCAGAFPSVAAGRFPGGPRCWRLPGLTVQCAVVELQAGLLRATAPGAESALPLPASRCPRPAAGPRRFRGVAAPPGGLGCGVRRAGVPVAAAGCSAQPAPGGEGAGGRVAELLCQGLARTVRQRGRVVCQSSFNGDSLVSGCYVYLVRGHVESWVPRGQEETEVLVNTRVSGDASVLVLTGEDVIKLMLFWVSIPVMVTLLFILWSSSPSKTCAAGFANLLARLFQFGSMVGFFYPGILNLLPQSIFHCSWASVILIPPGLHFESCCDLHLRTFDG